jgi:hypothetical protein
MKIRPVGAELFPEDGRADRQIDMTKLIVVFRNCANAPKMRCSFTLESTKKFKVYAYVKMYYRTDTFTTMR